MVVQRTRPQRERLGFPTRRHVVERRVLSQRMPEGNASHLAIMCFRISSMPPPIVRRVAHAFWKTARIGASTWPEVGGSSPDI